LCLVFVLTLPLLNPWVCGDGVGYYAFVRAQLIEHNLDFTEDYRHANQSFREPRIDENACQLLAAYEQSLAKLADVPTPAAAYAAATSRS
jgi:hypothetical protein